MSALFICIDLIAAASARIFVHVTSANRIWWQNCNFILNSFYFFVFTLCDPNHLQNFAVSADSAKSYYNQILSTSDKEEEYARISIKLFLIKHSPIDKKNLDFMMSLHDLLD